jgi:FtsH-binding integral membrane protein
VSNPVVLFLGSVFSALVSGLFWTLARRADETGLARATAAAVVVFGAAALYFGSQL